ncbi:hypothetical protein KDE13_09180 [Campylobacter sp. faydin G-140]|uniref:hypothetical protein n=1 Tax=Campylobacter anatolicus TaxID=2829105 RepID=UPI001B9DC447|nr:hypothetical protein [Campylobacter anatolicus]MBR8466505.1 hypothetical protein [Campylobacter anatolicus]
MRKFILSLLMVASSAFGYCPTGCVDNGIGVSLGEQSIANFTALDAETATVIGEIIAKIHQAHQILEVQSKEILIQNQKLLQLQAEVKQEILFNEKIINKLQSNINTQESELKK